MSGVLILDDDTDFRELFGELLSMVVTPCIAAGTLAELQDREGEVVACDFAFLDVNLGPGQPTGIDAARWLVAHGFHGKLVYLTGHAASTPALLDAAEETRACVLTKPVEASLLTELLSVEVH